MPCLFGAFVDESLRGVLEIYSCAPHPYSEVVLVVDPACAGAASAGPAARGCKLGL
jgi:hypothetical protein